MFEFIVQALQLQLLPVEFREYSHFRPQDFGDNGDRKIIDCPMLVALEAVEVGQMHSGNEDDGCFLKARMLADDLGEFEAVDLWHAYIHQYDSYISFEELLESLLGRCGLD